MHGADWRDLRAELGALHAAALAAADPASAVRRHLEAGTGELRVAGEPLPLAPGARLWLVAAGKAARGMAAAALGILGPRVTAGVVVHPHGAPAPSGEPDDPIPGLRRFAAGHPLPDAGSLAAGEAVWRLIDRPRPDDLLLLLLSGGASALLELPRPGLGLDALRAATGALQRAGADVVELNVVRRALSQLKGGGLARHAAPARVATLALSDVLGDRPEAIGSGPTVPSPSGPAQALALLERRNLLGALPEVATALAAARVEAEEPSPPVGPYVVVGSNHLSAEAVRTAAEARGYRTEIVTTSLQGEARAAGATVGRAALDVARRRAACAPPVCLVFGGETTVTVRGAGRGGRNLELALGAASALAGCAGVAVLAFATDGVDGNSSAAGAFAAGDTLARAAAAGLSAERALAENDTEPFFRALGDALPGGPTGTNVNDLAIALVAAAGAPSP